MELYVWEINGHAKYVKRSDDSSRLPLNRGNNRSYTIAASDIYKALNEYESVVERYADEMGWECESLRIYSVGHRGYVHSIVEE